MANYAILKAAIAAAIKQNGNNEITGALLQQQLLAMVNSLGVGYQYAGIATPATNPGTPDQNVFYIASTAGTYTNFNGLVLTDGEIAILKYNGAWSKDSTGAASAAQLNQLGQDVHNFPLFWKEESYIDTNGLYVDYKFEGFSTTWFIPIIEGFAYVLNGIASQGSVVNAVSFYDNEKKYISGLHYTEYTEWDDYELECPINAKYIRLCKTDGNDNYLTISNSAYIFAKQAVESQYIEYMPQYSIRDSYIDKTDGTIIGLTPDFNVSSQLKIGENKKIIIDGEISGSVIYGVAFYDSANICLGGITSGVFNKVELTTPENTAYVCFCKRDGYAFNVYLNIYDFITDVQEHTIVDAFANLQGYIRSDKYVKLPAGTFVINTALSIPDGTHLQGIRGSTIFKLGSATSCINITNGKNITISGITFDGGSEITPSDITLNDVKNRIGEGTKTGIYLSGAIKSILITNCHFKNFELAGVRAHYTSGDLTECYKVTDCVFTHNWYGLLSDIRSEYNTIVGCSFNYNEIGSFVAGGNNNFSCDHFEKNAIGFVVIGTGGNNDSHGVIGTSSINHNTVFSACCIDVNYGYIFDGCNIFEGDIQIENSKGVLFDGCMISAGITQAPRINSVNMVSNCIFQKDYSGGTITGTTNLLLKNNHFIDGTDSSNINN